MIYISIHIGTTLNDLSSSNGVAHCAQNFGNARVDLKVVYFDDRKHLIVSAKRKRRKSSMNDHIRWPFNWSTNLDLVPIKYITNLSLVDLTYPFQIDGSITN